MSNQFFPSAPTMQPSLNPQSYTPLQVGQPVYVQPIPINSIAWGKDSQVTVCPFCRASAATRVEYQRGLLTWASCCAITLLGLNAGCCLIPCCMDEFKDAYHYCPSCNSLLGIRKPLH